jgi:hypothetical protein
MRRLILFLALTLSPSLALAQSTTVSGNVTDLGGQVWSNGTVVASFVPAPGTSLGQYTWSGGTFNPGLSITAGINGSGNYTMSIPSNTVIIPANSKWTFTANSGTTSLETGTVTTTVTGATQTVNFAPPAISISAGPNAVAYVDGEVSANIGQSYYSLTLSTLRLCTTVVGSSCTVWSTIGGGTGLTNLNGLVANTQTFATGTAGTDFGISSVTATHTFNLPSASASNRGLLLSADWTTFNSKLSSPVSLTTQVSQILPVPNGGIGVGTLTGVAKGNGTSPFTTAAASDISGLWSGTCNSTTFLRGDGSCQTPAGSGTINTALQFSLPYYSAAGTASTLSGVNGPTAPNGVPQFWVTTPSGGVSTAPASQLAGVPVDATNPSTLLVTDRATYLNWTSGTALALPAVATTFASNLPFALSNTAGATLTVTPNVGASDLIDGASSGTLLNNFAVHVYQDSTTAPGHWFTIKYPTFAAFGPTCANPISWSTTTGFSCLAGTSGGIPYFSAANTWASSGTLGAGQFVLGGGAGLSPTSSFSVVPPANGGTGLANPAAHNLLVAEGSSNFALVPSPTTNGSYLCRFNVIASAAVDPTCDLGGIPTNAQTGTSYTVASSDRASYVTFSNASAIAVTLPQAGSTGFGSNFPFVTCDIGAGTATITPTTSTISYTNGTTYTSAAATLALTTGQCAWVYSDNTNYFAVVRTGGGGGGTVTSVDGSAGNGVQTVQGGSIAAVTTSGTVQGSLTEDTQTGVTSYAHINGDRGKLLIRSNSGTAMTDTLSQAAAGAAAAFGPGWYEEVLNTDATATDTITATTSTFSGTGTTTLVIPAGIWCKISSDGTNYKTECSGGSPAITSTTAVTVTNPTINTDTKMIELALPKGYLNTLGQGFLIRAGGLYSNTAATSPALTFNAKLCTVSGCGSGTVVGLGQIVSGTTSATATTNNTWVYTLFAITNATGATGNLLAKGDPGLTIDLSNVVSNPDTVYTDVNTATSSNIDLTAALFLDFTVAQSVAGASNSYKQLSAMIAPQANPAFGNNGPCVSGGTAGQICTSNGAGATAAFKDFPQVFEFPAANCVNAVAGVAWSTGATPVSACRAGTNNLGGTLNFADGGTAQFDLAIPGDWDTASNPFVKLFFTDGANTSGTEIFQVQVSCYVSDFSATDDVAFATAQVFTTRTAVAANRSGNENLQLNSTSMSGCVAGGSMILKITRNTDTAASVVPVSKMTVTIPRLLTVQAN